MKPSYKLYGIIWDRKPVESISILFYNGDVGIVPNYYEPVNLFDTGLIIRKILLSKLLGIEKVENFKKLIKDISSIDELIIEVDIFPSENKVLASFYKKRVLQICSQLKSVVTSIYVSDMHVYSILQQ
ncbi:MAG: hypothetical protein PUC01_10365 [Spirochaetales bacterium]|nr:hypothetical protein [Spirochaetales bacterium]